MKLIKFIFFIVIILGLAAFFTPLDLYYDKIKKNFRPIQLDGIDGSVVKGSAQQVKYLGMDLGRVNWLLYPSSYNAATLDVKLHNQDYDIKAKYIKKTKFDIIKDLKGTFDWQFIANKIKFSHGKISGYIELDFDHLEMHKGIPHIISGRATTKDLRIVKPVQKELGEIEVVFTSDNPQIIVGQVNSNSNVLNVSGAIYIHKNHRWEIKLTLIPLPGEYEVEYALQGIGDRRRSSGRTLNLAGFY
jgi:hypothetical protein